MRVPVGFISSLINTQAFESNRTYEPSLRRVGYFVRTITARIMSPDLTCEFGNAFFTAQTMRSPTPAVHLVYLPRAVDPPRTLMTSTSFAPLLSATSNLDSFWSMVLFLRQRCYAVAASTTRVTTHDLVFEIGRHSAISTLSPSFTSLFASCA